MSAKNIETVWDSLLVGGISKVDPDERIPLAQWAASKSPANLTPHSMREAVNVAALIRCFLEAEPPYVEAVLVRFAVAGLALPMDAAKDDLHRSLNLLVEQFSDVSEARRDADDDGGALEALVQAMKIAEVLPPDLYRWGWLAFKRADMVERATPESRQEIERWLRTAVESVSDSRGADHSDTLFCLQTLGRFLDTTERWEEAEHVLADAIQRATERYGESSEIVTGLARDLVPVRRSLLLKRENGMLYAWALRSLRDTHDGDWLEIALGMLRMMAEQSDDFDFTNWLYAEVGRLLCATGRIEEALEIAETHLTATLRRWDAADIYGAAASALRAKGDDSAIIGLIRRTIDHAERAHVFETESGQAMHDLLEAFSEVDGVLALAERQIPASARSELEDFRIERAIDKGDLDGALALLRAAMLDNDEGAVLYLLQSASIAGRRDIVLAAVPMIDRKGVAHWAVKAMFRVGAEDQAIALMERLLPGSNQWSRVEALSMAARHYGKKQDRERFDAFAASCIAEVAQGDPFMSWQPLNRVAEGALGLMTPTEAIAWAHEKMSDELAAKMVFGVFFHLCAQNRMDEARAILDDLSDDDHPRAENLLLRTEASARSVASIDACQLLMDAGRWDDGMAKLAALPNRLLAVGELTSLAEKAGAAGDTEAATRAIQSALTLLPGKLLNPPTAEDADYGDSFDAGRSLGAAAHRWLLPEARASFAETAVMRAAGMKELPAATPYVLAAGYASLPDRST